MALATCGRDNGLFSVSRVSRLSCSSTGRFFSLWNMFFIFILRILSNSMRFDFSISVLRSSISRCFRLLFIGTPWRESKFRLTSRLLSGIGMIRLKGLALWIRQWELLWTRIILQQTYPHFDRSFSGKCHYFPGVYLSRSYSYFRVCILPVKFYCDPFCCKSIKKSSIAFIATRSVETGQITQLYPQDLNVSMSMNGVFPNSVMLANNRILDLCSLSSFATNLNSSAVSSPSGKIISAPASMQAFDLLMHSSIPCVPFASVRAHIKNSLSDILRLVFLAIYILSTICFTEINSLPLRWPHLLGKT